MLGMADIHQYIMSFNKHGTRPNLVALLNTKARIGFVQNLRTKPLEERSKGYVMLDLSRKKENMPVFLFNDVDSNEPIFFEYLLSTAFPKYEYNHGRNGTGCDCEDDLSSTEVNAPY